MHNYTNAITRSVLFLEVTLFYSCARSQTVVLLQKQLQLIADLSGFMQFRSEITPVRIYMPTAATQLYLMFVHPVTEEVLKEKVRKQSLTFEGLLFLLKP